MADREHTRVMSREEYDAAIAAGENMDEETVIIVEPLDEPTTLHEGAGHYDGEAEDGIRRFRKPPDFFRSVSGGSVEAQVCVTAPVAPSVGDTIEIDGRRYTVRMLDRLDVHVPGRPSTEFYVELLLDDVGRAPVDPLVPRARAIIERLGGTVEGLSATREQHAVGISTSIHAVVSWPGRTADVDGMGASDHRALVDLEEALQHFAPTAGQAQ